MSPVSVISISKESLFSSARVSSCVALLTSNALATRKKNEKTKTKEEKKDIVPSPEKKKKTQPQTNVFFYIVLSLKTVSRERNQSLDRLHCDNREINAIRLGRLGFFVFVVCALERAVPIWVGKDGTHDDAVDEGHHIKRAAHPDEI